MFENKKRRHYIQHSNNQTKEKYGKIEFVEHFYRDASGKRISQRKTDEKFAFRQLKSAIIAYENLRRPRPEKDREEEAGTKRVKTQGGRGKTQGGRGRTQGGREERKAVAEERKAVAEERKAVAEEREAVAVDQKQTVK